MPYVPARNFHWFPLRGIIAMLGVMLLCAVSSQAQTSPATGTSGRSRTARTSPKYSVLPFDVNLEKLPPHFYGHDVEALVGPLQERGHPTKGEFETTQEYEQRLKQLSEKPVLGNLRVDSYYAFKADTEFDYDADRQSLGLSVKAKTIRGDLLMLFLHSTDQHLRSYTAKNAFGAEVEVNVEDDEYYSLEFDNGPDIGVYIAMAPTDAEKAKPSINALVVCKLKPPFVDLRTDYHRATFDSPFSGSSKYYDIFIEVRAIWFYDFESGQVLAKVKAPQPDSH